MPWYGMLAIGVPDVVFHLLLFAALTGVVLVVGVAGAAIGLRVGYPVGRVVLRLHRRWRQRKRGV